MLIQQMCKAVDISTFQFKAHQGGNFLHTVHNLQRCLAVHHVFSYDFPQDVPGQTSLAGEHKDESFFQFVTCILRDGKTLDLNPGFDL